MPLQPLPSSKPLRPGRVPFAWGLLTLCVDADVYEAHPRAVGPVVDLVTAIELMEMQWKKDHP